MAVTPSSVQRATPAEAATVAKLLHDFNTEFDTETPGIPVLTERLTAMLATDRTLAYLGGDPARGVALLTSRPNVWYATPVWLLDDLYVEPEVRGEGIGGALIERILADASAARVAAVEILVDAPDVDAQRFYERHGFHGVEPVTGERAYYYALELS